MNLEGQYKTLQRHAVQLIQRERPASLRQFAQVLYRVEMLYGLKEDAFQELIQIFAGYKQNNTAGFEVLLGRIEQQTQKIKAKVKQDYYKEVGIDQDHAYHYQQTKSRLKIAKERRANLTEMNNLLKKQNHMLKNEAERVARQYKLLKQEYDIQEVKPVM